MWRPRLLTLLLRRSLPLPLAGEGRGEGMHEDAAKSRPSVLVINGDQPVEQAHAKAAGALRHGVAVLLRPGDAGDVEMRPRRLADEALEELRGGDRAGAAVADVLHIGNVGLDDLVVFLAER